MKFFNLKLILIIAILFSSSLFAKEREQKIRLMGKVKANISKRVTVKEIENGLTFIEEKVYNPYEERSDFYGGVSLKSFIKKYATDSVVAVRFIAMDDYETTITKSEWDSMRIILSTRMNREYMSIKSKGPLRIVFPDYDPKKKEYQVNMPSWIWMIKKIEFR